MSETLFPMDDVAAAKTVRPFVDFFNLYAIERASMPKGWRWFSSEALNYQAPRDQQSFLLCGAVVPNVTKGKNAGQPNWKARDKSKDRSFSVSVPAMNAFREEWEVAEGRCHECYGTGEVSSGWSRETGATYRTCKRCAGTGGPRSVEATP